MSFESVLKKEKKLADIELQRNINYRAAYLYIIYNKMSHRMPIEVFLANVRISYIIKPADESNKTQKSHLLVVIFLD